MFDLLPLHCSATKKNPQAPLELVKRRKKNHLTLRRTGLEPADDEYEFS